VPENPEGKISLATLSRIFSDIIKMGFKEM
jgi:hypothetical protein